METIRRLPLLSSILIGLFFLLGTTFTQTAVDPVAAFAYKKSIDAKKLCSTDQNNPLPDSWRAIAFEAAENIRGFFAILGYKNQLFEHPENIKFIHWENANWGITFQPENDDEPFIAVDRETYLDFINTHGKDGLVILKMFLHHELVHLFLLNICTKNECVNLWLESDKKEGKKNLYKECDTLVSTEVNIPCESQNIFSRLVLGFIKPYSPETSGAYMRDQNHERLADIIGDKAAQCPLCIRTISNIFLDFSGTQINLRAMHDEQLRQIINREALSVAKTENVHPYNNERAAYHELMAREFSKIDCKRCRLHS